MVLSGFMIGCSEHIGFVEGQAKGENELENSCFYKRENDTVPVERNSRLRYSVVQNDVGDEGKRGSRYNSKCNYDEDWVYESA